MGPNIILLVSTTIEETRDADSKMWNISQRVDVATVLRVPNAVRVAHFHSRPLVLLRSFLVLLRLLLKKEEKYEISSPWDPSFETDSESRRPWHVCFDRPNRSQMHIERWIPRNRDNIMSSWIDSYLQDRDDRSMCWRVVEVVYLCLCVRWVSEWVREGR